MTTDLKDYIKVYNTLEKSLCKKIRKELENIEDWKTHTFYSYDKNDYKPKNNTKELDISWSNIKTKKILTDKIWKTIYQYIIVDFKSDHFKSWNGFTSIRFNRYKKGTTMRMHYDHIHSLFDGRYKGIPVISFIGVLNENYTGGELIINDQKIDSKAGDIIIFPSCFLYPHEVKEVKKGTRYSFVSWGF